MTGRDTLTSKICFLVRTLESVAFSWCTGPVGSSLNGGVPYSPTTQGWLRISSIVMRSLVSFTKICSNKGLSHCRRVPSCRSSARGSYTNPNICTARINQKRTNCPVISRATQSRGMATDLADQLLEVVRAPVRELKLDALNLLVQLRHGVRLERRLPADHGVQNDPHGPYVRGRAMVLDPRYQLRRRIQRGPAKRPAEVSFLKCRTKMISAKTFTNRSSHSTARELLEVAWHSHYYGGC